MHNPSLEDKGTIFIGLSPYHPTSLLFMLSSYHFLHFTSHHFLHFTYFTTFRPKNINSRIHQYFHSIPDSSIDSSLSPPPSLSRQSISSRPLPYHLPPIRLIHLPKPPCLISRNLLESRLPPGTPAPLQRIRFGCGSQFDT